MNDFYSLNLEMARAAIAAQDDDRICLTTYRSDGPAPTRCAAGVIAVTAWFEKFGVRGDPAYGGPQMHGPDGRLHDAYETLNHLFGWFGSQTAYDVLFKQYGAGWWDHDLVARFGNRPTHKQLALARLERAREWRGKGRPCASAARSDV